MKTLTQRLITKASLAREAFYETAKVLSSMALMFFVLVIIGPLTHAVQQIEHLF